MIAAPVGATHFRIISGAAEVDFELGKFVVDTKESTILPFNNIDTAPINLEATVTPASTHPLFVGLGIRIMGH
jgi:hypothetical protein